MSFMDDLKLNNETKNSSENNSYMTQAQNLWSMLDDMASNDPKSYK